MPWGKIVDSKKFIYCHNNIVNWNDSACEEAFHNAKRRFWAQTNGHRCDIYLPDPDKYIEKIDWNPEIDSEMIEELDWAYFAPNVTESDDLLEGKNKRTKNSSSVWAEGHIEDPGYVGNAWEHGIQCISNTGEGWNQRNLSDSGKANNDGNPWDSSVTQVNGGIVDSAWRDKVQQGDTSWNTKGFSSDARGMVDGSWRDKVHQGGATSWKTKGFASDTRNNTRGWNQKQRACNFDHYNRPWSNSYNRNVRNLTDRIQPSNQGNEHGWKYQWYGKRPKDAEFVNIEW